MERIKQLIIMGLCMVFGFIIHGSIQAWSTPEPEVIKEVEYVYLEPEPIIETVYIPYEEPFYRNLTEEDCYYLKDMAMREAEGQGIVGQCWVMYTVLCRAEAYGQSIKQVCESEAFKSSASRSGLKPNDDCNEALALIEEGWIPKPLWFRANKYHSFGTPLCNYGNHYFSCK